MKYNISDEQRKKGFCDGPIFATLMDQIHSHDADDYQTERDRLQTAFLAQMHMFSAGRPGAFVPTGHYPDIYMSYEDAEVVLVRRTDGSEKFGVVLTQRFMKGEKDKIGDPLVFVLLFYDKADYAVSEFFG